jgi:hypothetical protein
LRVRAKADYPTYSMISLKPLSLAVSAKSSKSSYPAFIAINIRGLRKTRAKTATGIGTGSMLIGSLASRHHIITFI